MNIVPHPLPLLLKERARKKTNRKRRETRSGGEDWKIGRWEDRKMGRWEDRKIGRWEDGKMGRWEDGKMGRREEGKMGRSEDRKIGRWEDGKMGSLTFHAISLYFPLNYYKR